MDKLLLISPLGWEKNVWDLIIKRKNMSKYCLDYISFLDNSFKEISRKEIEGEIIKKLKELTNNSIIITSSYGTVVLLSALCKSEIKIGKLIIIDGLNEIPNGNEIEKIFDEYSEEFNNDEEYYDYILSDEEKTEELKQISKHNLKYENKKYRLKLNKKKAIEYLKLYENIDSFNLLLNIKSQIKELKIFSTIDLKDIEYIKIDEHLLMLKNPDMI